MKKILSAALLSLLIGTGTVAAQSFDEFSSKPIAKENLTESVENLTCTLDWNNSLFAERSLENASLKNVAGMDINNSHFSDLYFSLLDNMRFEVNTEDPWGNNLLDGKYEIHNSDLTIRYALSDSIVNGNFASEIEAINSFGAHFDPYNRTAFIEYLENVKEQGPNSNFYVIFKEDNGTRWGGLSYAVEDIDAYIVKIESMPVGDDNSRDVLMQLTLDNWDGLQLQYQISTSTSELSNDYIIPSEDNIFLTVVYKGFPREKGKLSDFSDEDKKMYESSLFSGMGMFNNDLARHSKVYGDHSSDNTNNSSYNSTVNDDLPAIINSNEESTAIETQQAVESILESLVYDPSTIVEPNTQYNTSEPQATSIIGTYLQDSGVQLVDLGDEVQIYVPVEAGVKSGILTQSGSTLRSAVGFGELYTSVSALNDGEERALDTSIEMINNKPYFNFVVDKSSLDSDLSRIAFIGYSSKDGSRGTGSQPQAYTVNTLAIGLEDLF